MARKSMKNIRGGNGEENDEGLLPSGLLNNAPMSAPVNNAPVNNASVNNGTSKFNPDPYAHIRGGRRRKTRRAARKNRKTRVNRKARCMYRKSRRA